MTVNGVEYEEVKLLGKGKGGYSYLVQKDGAYFVLKQIHHEPCSYYAFGNKIEAEKRDYARLLELGIRMPRLLEVDEKEERILKEYIPGETVMAELESGKDVSAAKAELRSWLPSLYQKNTNIDYYPTNFIYFESKLYYIDYECNDYHEEWDYEHWGESTWVRKEEQA